MAGEVLPSSGKPNKIVYGGETLIDLTADTVTPGTLKQGVTAHAADGSRITGTMAPPEPVQESDINFYDYDGTLLHAWSLAELQSKTELPELPTQPGLICQGWNWTLAELKAQNSEMDVGANYITNDGKTRIYVRLTALHKTLAVNLGMNGTATVDWGDGSEPDTLTGTGGANVKTPVHEYAAVGDYMISITVTGSANIPGVSKVPDTTKTLSSALLYETADNIGWATTNLVKKIELGANISLGNYAFGQMSQMDEISIPVHIRTSVYIFNKCEGLSCVVIPHGETNLDIACLAFTEALKVVPLPGTLTTLGASCLLETGVFKRILLPKAISVISSNGLSTNVFIQEFKAFGPLTRLNGQCFRNNRNCAVYDFTACTSVPILDGLKCFEGVPSNYEFRVPASLLSAWKSATNWAEYAPHIVGV